MPLVRLHNGYPLKIVTEPKQKLHTPHVPTVASQKEYLARLWNVSKASFFLFFLTKLEYWRVRET